MRLNTYSIVPCAILFIQATTFATGLVSTTYNDEKQAQAVTVSFYQLRPSTWTDTGLVNKFKNAIATAVNTYCRANLSQCGLNATIDFLGANVFINSDPIQRNSYLDVTFHVKYPDGVQLTSTASTNFVLPKTILEAITATARARVKLSLGYEIVKIGDVIYYKSPDDRLNMILIPISCCLLLVVIIVAIALHCWSEARRSSEKRKRKRDQEHANKKKAHAADKAKLNEKKRKSPKVGPSPSDTPAKSKFGKHKVRFPDVPDVVELEQLDASTHDRFHTHIEGDVNTNAGDYKDTMPTSKLPPLSTNQEQEPHTNDKEKRKHRKHKKSKKNKHNFENPTFTAETAPEVPADELGSAEVLIKSPQHNIVQPEEKVSNRLGDSGSDNEIVKRDSRDQFIDEI
ncbi:uncharacterized protein LOC135502994 isoform X5 [Lineus longissimus]|uniref:uncharacterized protein LOC135502994 isoform X5 n=1 Tax=Lineus longissimus TaxID=88925 RepID=UPI00315D432D